jgi:hypothetical protein
MQVKSTTTVEIQSRDKEVKPLDLAALVQAQILDASDNTAEVVKVERNFMGHATVTFTWHDDIELEESSTNASVQEPTGTD